MLESIAVRSCKAVNSHIQIWIQNPHIVLSPLENSVPVECYHINYRIHLAATAMSHHLLGLLIHTYSDYKKMKLLIKKMIDFLR